MPEVSVVIPARNAESTLADCLDALGATSPTAFDWDVVVVDDGSTDDTAAIARRHPLEPKVINGGGKGRGDSRGSYAARNAGAAVATSRVLAFTDADCMPSPGWLMAGLAAVDEEATGCALAGGRIEWLTATTPSARYDRASYLDQKRSIAEQGFAATANLFVVASTFDEIGGFDGSLRSGGDWEFARRAGAAGHRIAWAPTAVVRHRPRSTYVELWALHRRLGAGWADLADRGLRPAWWREPALRVPTLGMVVEAAAEQGDAIRRRQVIGAHLVARTARVVGRVSHRG